MCLIFDRRSDRCSYDMSQGAINVIVDVSLQTDQALPINIAHDFVAVIFCLLNFAVLESQNQTDTVGGLSLMFRIFVSHPVHVPDL